MNLLEDDFVRAIVGAQDYLDHVPGREQDPRIVLRVVVGSARHDVLAVLDTGATCCVFPEVGPRPADDDIRVTLRTAHGTCHGALVRGEISLVADGGRDLRIETTFFVPEEPWPAPMFVGFRSCIEQVRLAIDAPRNRLYFGA